MSKELRTIIRNLAVVMSLIVCFTMSYVTSFAMTRDLDGHWASNVINEWFDKGLAGGYPDDTFRPNANITRAEFMTLVNNAFEKTSEIQINFSDVKSNDWYYKTVQKALAAGYIGGYPDGTIRPNQAITRQEAAVVISKIKMLIQKDISKAPFNDDKMISDWSKDYVNAVVTAHIMNGYPDNTFKPNEKISRAEAIVALDNALKYADEEESKEASTLFSTKGLYGPESGEVTYASDVIIEADQITLQNCSIEGNLIISEKVGEGNIILNNVTVLGNTYVRGGGNNSIHLNNGSYEQIIIEKINSNQVRIVSSNAKVTHVVIAESAAGKKAILEGAFENVALNATTFELSTQNETTIQSLVINSKATENKLLLAKGTIIEKFESDVAIAVKGKGIVKVAELKALDVTFETAPESSKLIVSNISTGGNNGGSSSNGGNSSSNVAVSQLAFTQTSLDLLAGGSAETILFTISPTNATNKAITWISSDASVATVNSGVVVPLKAGTVTITAISDSDHTKMATCIVTVVDTSNVSTSNQLMDAIRATGVKTITLTENIIGNIDAEHAGDTDLTLNFGEYAITGNVSLTAENANNITFNSSGSHDSIIGNLTVSAPKATMNNQVNVSGKITIQAISNHTWNQSGNAGGIEITADGGAFNFQMGNLGSGVTLNPRSISNALVLKGDLHAIPMRIVAPSRLEINAGAQPPAMIIDSTASGTEIDNYSDDPVDLTANAEICVSGSMTCNTMSTVQPVIRQVKPIFNPGASAVKMGTEVIIRATGADFIYYTTDGSTPENKVVGMTKIYTSPIVINANQVIKAIATKEDQIDSLVSTSEYTIIAPVVVPVSSIKLSTDAITLTEGGNSAVIESTVEPMNATHKAINWKTSDASVAIVSNGVITSVGVGTATISAISAENESIVASALVTVIHKKPTGTSYVVDVKDTFNSNTGLNITKDIKLMKGGQLVTGGYVIVNSKGTIVGKDTDGDGITRVPCALDDGNLKIKLADETLIPIN